MPFEVTTTEKVRVISGVRHHSFTIVGTGAGSASEFSFEIPPVGTVANLAWDLTSPGSSSTMIPTVHFEAGPWSHTDEPFHRGWATLATGREVVSKSYDEPPGVSLHINPGLNSATEDAGFEIRILIVKGAV